MFDDADVKVASSSSQGVVGYEYPWDKYKCKHVYVCSSKSEVRGPCLYYRQNIRIH